MHDVAFVGMGEPHDCASDHAERLLRCKRAVGFENLLQRRSVDPLLGDPRPVGVFDIIVDLDDVGVIQSGQRRGLSLETFGLAGHPSNLWRQLLDRRCSLKLAVVCAEDHASGTMRNEVIHDVRTERLLHDDLWVRESPHD